MIRPLTDAEIRREVRRQLKRRGFSGYTPNPPARSPDDTPRCPEPDCDRIPTQHGRRCFKCSEERRAALEVDRKKRWYAERKDRPKTSKRKEAA